MSTATEITVSRHPIAFEVEGCRLHGMLDMPPAGLEHGSIGAVMLNSDDGCRLGPHGLWVRLARRLCAEGYPCLRFDYRGCGDSEGPEGSPPGDVGLADAVAAEGFLRERTGVESTVLVGICYGAEIGLLASRCIDSVIGVVTCSAARYVTASGYAKAVEDASDYARSYVGKLFRADTWRKLARGQVHLRLILGHLLGILSPAGRRRDRTGAMAADAIASRGNRCVPSLFIYGGADPQMRKYMRGYREEAADSGGERSFCVIPGSDHNFASVDWSQKVIQETVEFTHKLCRSS